MKYLRGMITGVASVGLVVLGGWVLISFLAWEPVAVNWIAVRLIIVIGILCGLVASAFDFKHTDTSWEAT